MAQEDLIKLSTQELQKKVKTKNFGGFYGALRCFNGH